MPHDNSFTQDALSLRALRESRLREMQRNLDFQTQDPTRFRSGATPSEVSTLQGDLASDPYTGVQEQKRVASIRGLQEQAQMEGFNSPQERANYLRRQEQRKLEQPLDIARLQGEADLAKQRETSRGALDVAKVYGSGGGALQQFLGMGGDINQLRGFSTPRGGSVSLQADPTQPANIYSGLQRARDAAAKAGTSTWFGMGGPSAAQLGAQDALNQAIASAIATHPASDNTKRFVTKIRGSAKYKDAPIEQILQSISPNTPLTPQEQAELRDLLTLVRGKDF